MRPFDEIVMAVNSSKIVAHWEPMKEWLMHQTKIWKLAVELEQYKAVMIVDADLKDLAPPNF